MKRSIKSVPAVLMIVLLTALPTVASAQNATPDSIRPAWPKTTSAVILASAGSLAGFYAGALIGYSTGPYDENFGGLFIGGAIGSLVGSTMGSTAVTRNLSGSFMGSIAGGLTGLMVASGVNGATNNDWFALCTFTLIHGAITAVVAS
jgi:hypothetical protein